MKLFIYMMNNSISVKNASVGLLLIILVGLSFNMLTDKPKITFSRINELNLDLFDVAEGVYTFKDEIFVVGWKYNISKQESNACLSKLDSNGEVIWSKILDFRDAHGREISCNKDGIYLVGDAKDETLGSYQYIVKYDFNGNQEWIINGTQVSDVEATEEYIFFLKDNNLIKLDHENQVIWEKAVTGTAIFINDNIVYVGGSTTLNATGGCDVLVTAVDNEGNILWNSRRTSDIGDQLADVCATDDGVYIIGSGTKGWDSSFITMFDPVGVQLWDKKLISSVNGSLHSIFSYENQVYAVGALGDSPSEFDTLFTVIDNKGTIVWSDVINSEGEYYAYGIFSDKSKVYVVGSKSTPHSVERTGTLLVYKK